MEAEDYKDHGRVIVHIDIDCFYAQVETLLHPEYQGKPLGVQQKHLVVTCNYLARAKGVKKLMAIKDAMALCPDLILTIGEDLSKYRAVSNQVHDLLLSFSDHVEKLGMDENFVDVTDLAVAQVASGEAFQIQGHVASTSKARATNFDINRTSTVTSTGNESDPDNRDELELALCDCGCYGRLTSGSLIAGAIREQLKDTLNLTCCAGIAHNKVLAKLVGSTHKPNQQTTIFPYTAGGFMRNLNAVRSIPGVGHATYSKLQSLNIETVLELQSCSKSILISTFGSSAANWLQNLSLGIDPSPVKRTGKSKSIGCEDGFKPVITLTELQEKFTGVLNRAWKLVVEDGRMPRQVKITFRKASSVRVVRQTALPNFCLASVRAAVLSLIQEEQLIQAIINTVGRMLDVCKPFVINLVGLSFTNFPDTNPSTSPENSIARFFSSGTSTPSCPPLKKFKAEKSSNLASNVPKNSLLRYFSKK